MDRAIPIARIGFVYGAVRAPGVFLEWTDTEPMERAFLCGADSGCAWWCCVCGIERTATMGVWARGLVAVALAGGVAILGPGVMAFGQGVAGGPAAEHRMERPGVEVPNGGSRRLEDLKKLAVFAVPGGPDWSVVTDRAVWVSASRPGRVVELDAQSNKVGLTAEVNKPCSGLAWGFGSVWVPSCGDGAVLRIDPATGKETARVVAAPANSEGGITVGAGSVWMVVKGGRLLRIDPAKNAVMGEVEVPAGAENVVFGDGSVWVTSFDEGKLLRVDPAAMRVAGWVAVGPKPRFVTVGEGAVWTLNQGDGTVSRVEMATGKVVATVRCGLPGPGGEISFGEGGVWATVYDVPLTEIDPKTDAVVRQWKGAGGDGIRVGLGSVWLSNGRQGTVWRIDPRQ